MALVGTMARLFALSWMLIVVACTRSSPGAEGPHDTSAAPKPPVAAGPPSSTRPSAVLSPAARPSVAAPTDQRSTANEGNQQPASGLKPAPQDAAMPRIEAPPPPPKPRPLLAASLRAFGFGASGGPFLPEDYAIGPLQDTRAADKELASVISRARGFLTSLATGRIETDQLYPTGREALAWLLAPLADEAKESSGPSSQATARQPARVRPLRLGKVSLDGEAAFLKFLLPGDTGRTGLLSLRKSGTAWYVENLSLDPPGPETIAFDPGSRTALLPGAGNGR